MAQCPDNVGITNLLRFQFTPNGAGNIPEFGDVTKPEDFKWLYPDERLPPYYEWSLACIAPSAAWPR